MTAYAIAGQPKTEYKYTSLIYSLLRWFRRDRLAVGMLLAFCGLLFSEVNKDPTTGAAPPLSRVEHGAELNFIGIGTDSGLVSTVPYDGHGLNSVQQVKRVIIGRHVGQSDDQIKLRRVGTNYVGSWIYAEFLSSNAPFQTHPVPRVHAVNLKDSGWQVPVILDGNFQCRRSIHPIDRVTYGQIRTLAGYHGQIGYVRVEGRSTRSEQRRSEQAPLNPKRLPLKSLAAFVLSFLFFYFSIGPLSDNTDRLLWPWLCLFVTGGAIGAFGVYTLLNWWA